MTKRRRLKALVGKAAAGIAKTKLDARSTVSMLQTARGISDALISVVEAFENVTEEIIVEVLEPTLEIAKEYCPVDTGKLVDSAYLELNTFRGKPRAEMGFARAGDPWYAAIVHESLWFHHEAPTQAKFLERAVFEDLNNIKARIEAAYRDFVR